MANLNPKGIEAARQAYEAEKAPSDYYEDTYDFTRKLWLKVKTVGLFYCWLSDGMPTKQQTKTVT